MPFYYALSNGLMPNHLGGVSCPITHKIKFWDIDLFYYICIRKQNDNMETIIKILGTIALVIVAIALLPFAIAGLVWLFKVISGFTIGGFLLIVFIALLIYLIWG